jgi:hypothetical protein
MRRVVRWLKCILTGRKEEHRGLEAEEKRRRTTGGQDAGARQRRAAIVIQKTFRGYLVGIRSIVPSPLVLIDLFLAS